MGELTEDDKLMLEQAALFVCGETGECHNGKPHRWDGPGRSWQDGNMLVETTTCSTCGIDAYTHDLWTMP